MLQKISGENPVFNYVITCISQVYMTNKGFNIFLQNQDL